MSNSIGNQSIENLYSLHLFNALNEISVVNISCKLKDLDSENSLLIIGDKEFNYIYKSIEYTNNEYTISLTHPLNKLHYIYIPRCFINKSLVSIISVLCEDIPVIYSQNIYDIFIEFCYQYQESSFNFMKRIIYEYNIKFICNVDGSLYFFSTFESNQYTITINKDTILNSYNTQFPSISFFRSMIQYNINTYDYLPMDNQLNFNNQNKYNIKASTNSKQSISQDTSENVKIKLSYYQPIELGNSISIYDIPYYIYHYENTINTTIIYGTQDINYTPPMLFTIPNGGHQSVIVKGYEHPFLQVSFLWNTENIFNVRYITPIAGEGYGTFAIPRIDQELILGFIDGNPNKPIAIGSPYNAIQSPYTDNPYIFSTKTRNINDSTLYNEISMDDSTGKTHLQSANDFNIISTHGNYTCDIQNGNYTTTINGNHTTNSSNHTINTHSTYTINSETITINGETIAIKCTNLSIEADNISIISTHYNLNTYNLTYTITQLAILSTIISIESPITSFSGTVTINEMIPMLV